MPRIYLDNAATSWPKPESVYRAVDEFQREVGASYGRGSHRSAIRCARVVDDARSGLAALLGEREPSRVVFANSGTDAIAIALCGLLTAGDHVVATVLEHNAVLRSLHSIRTDSTFVGIDRQGRVDPNEIAAALRPETKMVIATHASNVTGVVQPVESIAELVRDHPATFLIDAAQTVGKLALDVEAIGADFIAAPTHKGLLGPQGVGFLWIRDGFDPLPAPLRYGGTGANSATASMPDSMPERYEAGSLNALGIAGLAAAIQHLQREGVATLQAKSIEASERLCAGLAELNGVDFMLENDDAPNAGVVAFNIKGYDPHDAAAAMESIAGVECRAGLHCAPKAHEAHGTAPQGSVRFSPGPTTTEAEIHATLSAVTRLAETEPS